MPFAYKTYNQFGVYFFTCTVDHWVNVFTSRDYIEIVLDSIRYCKKNNGLKVYAWVIMTNNILLIVSSDKEKLSAIIRDFKKYTASKIIEAIAANDNESRKNWLLWLLQLNGNIHF